ncbi:transglycosylase domain-containing protein [Microvirga brassicacearum]|uniref:PBP1A family penicillin-binding protein n=1 Tax=Microvirga brassicacearum TaxID=2580413 RepID=A0A5N3P6A8_9HYPH|nr:PBP1A family penicillin-binding protein [Microvirga brassicacearum]KAB0265260.1 PBP1A family penicillin-binding protein [Microvirga brassicacearum]
MRPTPSTPLITRIKRAALASDAWLNTSLYQAGRGIARGWEVFSDLSKHLRFRGPVRVLLDLTSEATTLGLVGGVVLLALALPAFEETNDDWLKTQDLAVTFLDRYGQEVGRRGLRLDDSYKLEEFPDYLVKAALATEDRRFYEHWGIDPIGTFRALTVNVRGGGVVQGGSSITQQLAKNLFLSNERSLERKIKEAFLAVWLEFHLTKDEILKLYLDRAYMGGGAHGVVAAADYYFGKSAKDVTLAEAAMMAGLFKAPTKYAPHINLPAARARANDVLRNMVEAGFLTEGQIQTARRNPATPINRSRETTPDYYLDWAYEQIKQLAADKKLGGERILTVKTPLDTALQQHAEQTLENMLRQHGRQYKAGQGGIVIMDVDGALRAIVGGKDYGLSQFNRATDALRQPGSSFKPFVYTAALLADPKLRPTSTVVDRPICLGNWCPQNYGRSFSGSMPLTSALARSINSIPVWMSLQIGKGNAKAGRAQIIDISRKMGLSHPLADSSSLPIGAAEVTVIDMTASYAVFANGGKKATPYVAWEVKNSQGDVIYSRAADTPPEQILPTRLVHDMNFMLNKVVEEGTGKRSALAGIRSAGKTGTTNAYRDAWFVGYTGNLVAGVWYGNDDHSAMNNMTGGTLPAMTWQEVMTFGHQNLEIRPIPGIGPESAAKVAATERPADQATAPAAQGYLAGTLSRRSYEVLGAIGNLFKAAETASPMPGRQARKDPPGSDFTQPRQVAMP